jgi:rhodanese-related sulfurtransferase
VLYYLFLLLQWERQRIVQLEPELLAPEELDTDATVLDIRGLEAFDRAHVRGAIAIGRDAERVARTVDPDEPLVVVDDHIFGAMRFTLELYAMGLWNVTGISAADPEAWHAAGLVIATAPERHVHVRAARRWRRRVAGGARARAA